MNSAASASPVPRRQARGPLFAAGALIALLAANWGAAVARFAVNGLYWDQWSFFDPLFDEKGLFSVFTQQHGPHRQGLAFVLTSFVLRLSAWDLRVEALWIASWLVVAAVLMLVWKWRLTGRVGWSDLWLPLAALALRQYETVLIVPNLSHSVFPLVLLLVAAVVATRPLTVGRWAALGVIGGLAVFTGFGIFVWAGLVWLAVLRLGRAWRERSRQPEAWRAPLVGGLVLLGALARFASGYRFDPASAGAEFPHWPLSDYPWFVVRMLASRMDLVGGTGLGNAAGALMLLGGGAAWAHATWRVWREEAPSVARMAAVLLLTTGLSYAFFTASGRVHLGVAAGEAPRYTSLLVSLWLGLLAWAAAAERRAGMVVAGLLGWAMVVAPWCELRHREWRDWPGTLGLSTESRAAIDYANSRKIAWLAAWEETGDWRVAEQRQPEGIHPELATVQPGPKIDFLRRHRLSFAADLAVPQAWLPWWNPLGVTWVKALGGEHEQWMGDEAKLWIEGRENGFLNLRVAWLAPALEPADAALALTLAGRTARVTYPEMLAGVSVPAPTERSLLIYRSLVGVAPLDPPRDPRAGSFLVVEPTLSARPAYAVRWWATDDAGGLWPDEATLDLAEGFYGWEENGAFGWTAARLAVDVRSREARWLNLFIESRFGPINTGPVRIVIDGTATEVPWTPEGIRRSIELPGGRAHRIELINPAGARSPLAIGESGDARDLALKLRRITLDDAAVFPPLAGGGPAP